MHTGEKTTAVERHLTTIGGTQVEYLVGRRGPDLLLLHGVGESGGDWLGVMTRLSPSYRVYAPALPGYGRDSGAVWEPSPESYARFCHVFVDALGLECPVVACHSLGGLVALRVADQYRRAQDGRFTQTALRSLRAQVSVGGQRRVLLDQLPEVSVPTLVIWGAGDRVVPATHGRAAVGRLPNGRLEILDGLGHAVHTEDPGLVAAAIREFLDALP